LQAWSGFAFLKNQRLQYLFLTRCDDSDCHGDVGIIENNVDIMFSLLVVAGCFFDQKDVLPFI